MDKDLVYYLNSLGFTNEDIHNLLNLAPNLIITTYEDAINNVMLVVSKGFPIEDIDSLVMINPQFLSQPTKILSESLNAITGNIEEALKNDPFLI